jgi:hypothetical protein
MSSLTFLVDQNFTSHNFFIRTLFEAIFAPLETYHRPIRIDGFFKGIWDDLIMNIFEPFYTFVDDNDPPQPP